MKLPVIGGFTQAEGAALGAFTTSGDDCPPVPNLDVGIHGVTLDDGAQPFVFHSTRRTHKRTMCTPTLFRCGARCVSCVLRVRQGR